MGSADWRPLLARLRALPHVTAAAPELYGQVLIARGAKSGGALIDGVVPADQNTVSDLLRSVKKGSAAELEPEAIGRESHPQRRSVRIHLQPRGHPNSSGRIKPAPPIVIGQDLAETIGADGGRHGAGDQPAGGVDAAGAGAEVPEVPVVGIFKSGFYQYDSSYAFMRLADAQTAVLRAGPDLGDQRSRWTICTRPARWGGRSSRPRARAFETTNWMEQNRELFRALALEQIVTFIVLALIVCVAALNILIALTMMVMEKTRTSR
jgi:lipoprotein-releasing system permease protein